MVAKDPDFRFEK